MIVIHEDRGRGTCLEYIASFMVIGIIAFALMANPPNWLKIKPLLNPQDTPMDSSLVNSDEQWDIGVKIGVFGSTNTAECFIDQLGLPQSCEVVRQEKGGFMVFMPVESIERGEEARRILKNKYKLHYDDLKVIRLKRGVADG